jgi:hypothetical protein
MTEAQISQNPRDPVLLKEQEDRLNEAEAAFNKRKEAAKDAPAAALMFLLNEAKKHNDPRVTERANEFTTDLKILSGEIKSPKQTKADNDAEDKKMAAAREAELKAEQDAEAKRQADKRASDLKAAEAAKTTPLK